MPVTSMLIMDGTASFRISGLTGVSVIRRKRSPEVSFFCITYPLTPYDLETPKAGEKPASAC